MTITANNDGFKALRFVEDHPIPAEDDQKRRIWGVTEKDKIAAFGYVAHDGTGFAFRVEDNCFIFRPEVLREIAQFCDSANSKLERSQLITVDEANRRLREGIEVAPHQVGIPSLRQCLVVESINGKIARFGLILKPHELGGTIDSVAPDVKP